MTPPEILKALSQGHERWPGDALEAASSQRSKVSLLLLEKLAQAVAEIERIEAAGFPKPSLKRFLKAPSPLFYGVFLLADWREKAAYRPFARLMRFPWVARDNLLGEPPIEEPGYRITVCYSTATRNSFSTSPRCRRRPIRALLAMACADADRARGESRSNGCRGFCATGVRETFARRRGLVDLGRMGEAYFSPGADRARAPCSEGS